MHILKKDSQGHKGSFTFKSYLQLYLLYGLILLFANFATPTSPNTVSASTISETFSGFGNFPKGSIVSFIKDAPDSIELLNRSNSEYFLGVVSDDLESSINFKKDNANVSVALSGLVKVLVSDANGEIVKGDFIGSSWLEGVGMKADKEEAQNLVGIAQEDFDTASSNNYGEINTPQGTKDILVNSLLVRLYNKENSQTLETGTGGIQVFFASIIGKNISLVRIIIGSVIFFSSVFLVGLFVTSSVRSSFVSIGRNPLASSVIHKGMTKVAVVSVVILISGAAVSYAVMVA